MSIHAVHRKAGRVRLAGVLALSLTVAAACGDDGGGTAAGGSSESADGTPRIEVGAVPTADHAPLYVAQEFGLFEEQGLDVEVANITPGAGVLLAALDADDVQVLEQVPTFAGLGAEQGTDVQFFCGSWPVINAAFVVSEDSEMETAAEAGGWQPAVEALEGQTVGVAVTGSTIHYWARSVLQEAGVDPDSVDYVQVGTGPPAIPALEQGRVDALLTYPWMTEQLITSGQGKVLAQFDTDGPLDFSAQMQNGWVAPTEWLEANPEAATSFCDAITEANERIQDPDEHDAVAEVLTSAFGLEDEALVDALLDEDGSLALLDTDISCEGLDAAIDFALEHEQLTGDADYSCDALIWEGAPQSDA